MLDLDKNSKKLSVSIVSHGHGSIVSDLVKQLLTFNEVSEIIVTLNIPEPPLFDFKGQALVIQNIHPKGFGENHNSAFKLSVGDFFCVLNPDIVLDKNPFPSLIAILADNSIGIVAPMVLGSDGRIQDNMRQFLTPISLAKRLLGLDAGTYSLSRESSSINPDWVAGMFMLFNSQIFEKVQGFDERYYMYCEDVDICTRVWRLQYSIVGCLSTAVIHKVQRASHKRFRHLSWHISSIIRYFFYNSLDLPNKPNGS